MSVSGLCYCLCTMTFGYRLLHHSHYSSRPKWPGVGRKQPLMRGTRSISPQATYSPNFLYVGLGAADKAATGQFAVHYWGITTLVMTCFDFLIFIGPWEFFYSFRSFSIRGRKVFYSRIEIFFSLQNQGIRIIIFLE